MATEKPEKVTIHVLKPFVLSRLPTEGHKTPSEQRFIPGYHEIDAETAAHPYIQSLADGKIESAEKAVERETKAAAAAETAAKQARAQKLAAEQAAARLATAMHAGGESTKTSGLMLDVPVNQLRGEVPRKDPPDTKADGGGDEGGTKEEEGEDAGETASTTDETEAESKE